MDSRAPQKPWERLIPGAMTAPVNFRSSDFASSLPPAPGPAPPLLTRVAPPLPPRPAAQTYRPAYSSYSAPYGSSSFYSPGYSSGYSPYGYSSGFGSGLGSGFGSGLGAYGRLPLRPEEVAPSRFVLQAEESSRGAFQSIESIVHAFASVSMMMEATFSAVYNSFRAVLDVANHFSRLRAHLTRVLSAFALVRTLRYLYRRLQRLLGRRGDCEANDLWAESASDALAGAAVGGTHEPPVKSWPIFLFFAVILGGPFLIWKLLSAATDTERTESQWASGEDDHVVARAEFDFTAASDEEISVRAGDLLHLAPKELQPRVRGWLLASVDAQTSGLVPSNYVKVLGKRRGRRHAPTEATPNTAAQTPSPPVLLTAPPPVTLIAPHSLVHLEEQLEQVYGEAPSSSSVINIQEKDEL
ncbi:unnamed protein product [Knipowitschia caucasica]